MKRCVGGRLPSEKAIHSGTAVSASVTLWMVSDNSATEPVNATITAWIAAVAASATSDTLVALMPAAPVSAGSCRGS